MNYEFDVGVFIGRFQPLHIGHARIIEYALKSCRKLIVLVGSANAARTIKNPFSYSERAAVLQHEYRFLVETGRLVVEPVDDVPGDDSEWAKQVSGIVGQLTGASDTIALAGFGKDASSFYLDMFPDWQSIQISSQVGTLNSTDIREHYLKKLPVWPRDVMPMAANHLLEDFRWRPEFKELVAEAEYYRDYAGRWGRGPHITGDNIVLHLNEILLVTRGEVPGRGKLALPGGFREPNERLRDCALRELQQETGLDPTSTPGAITLDGVAWDAPYRSLRGDVITYVVTTHLPAEFDRSALAAADDAGAIGWYRFSDLRPDQFFDDHWSIVHHFTQPK